MSRYKGDCVSNTLKHFQYLYKLRFVVGVCNRFLQFWKSSVPHPLTLQCSLQNR